MDETKPNSLADVEASSTDEARGPPSPPRQHDNAIPDGGFVAWMQVAGSFCIFMNGWGLINTFGVYQTYYETALLGSSSMDISWIGSVQAFLLMFGGVVTGPLFDRGYFRALISLGSFLVVFGMMMTSLCTRYWQIMLAQGVTVGLGCGCLFIPSAAILPTYFSRKKALVLGIAASGSALGGVIYPITFYHLQPEIGFGWATRVIAFIILGTLILPVAIMRTRTKPASARKLVDPTAFREPPFMLFTLACFFAFTGLYIPFYYMGLYAIAHGTRADLGFYLFSILSAGSFFGRILPNALADKTGPLNMLLPCAAACVVLVFAWLGISSTAGLIVLSILYGFFSGCFVSLPPATIVTLSPSLDVVGTRMGMCFSLAAVGLLIGNPVAGTILGSDPSNYHWAGMIGWCGACISAGTLCLCGTRLAKVGWKVVVRT